MNRKIIAVINDHTGECFYILKGREGFVPSHRWTADKIESAGPYGEDTLVTNGKYSHFLNSDHYSSIIEEVSE